MRDQLRSALRERPEKVGGHRPLGACRLGAEMRVRENEVMSNEQ